MSERYIAIHSCVIDTHDKTGYGNPPEGKVVATSEMAARLTALLNEDEVINGILEMSKGQSVDDFVDDVVRHTKVQQ
jgi:hypothetical protein